MQTRRNIPALDSVNHQPVIRIWHDGRDDRNFVPLARRVSVNELFKLEVVWAHNICREQSESEIFSPYILLEWALEKVDPEILAQVKQKMQACGLHCSIDVICNGKR